MELRCEWLVDPLGIDVREPRLTWQLQAGPEAFDVVQEGWQIEVSSAPAGPPDLWDSGFVTSARMAVRYGGAALTSRTACFWHVRVRLADGTVTRWSDWARWTMGLLEPSDWEAAWIGSSSSGGSASYLRKEFFLEQVPEQATAYATALGVYDLWVNGLRVCDRMLAPEWTDYRRRVQVQTFDLMRVVRQGSNVIGAALADGWYAGRIGLDGGRAMYGSQPRLLVQLEAGDERVTSDGSWRVTNEGPIRAADILDGEVIDARCGLPGWAKPGFDDGDWQPVTAEPLAADPALVSQPAEPIRVIREIRPAAEWHARAGTLVVDFGENLAGVCRARLRGPRGRAVTLRHAEAIEDGRIYRENLRRGVTLDTGETLDGAAQEDTFVLAGTGGWEEFQPRFTYHGFRFVEVDGIEGVDIGELTALAVGTDLRRTGEFDCSEPLLRQIVEATARTQRANSMGIPTDCPQRDERLGWAGDVQLFAGTASILHDVAAFLERWLRDVRDAQFEDGRIASIAPNPFPPPRFYSNPAWADAGVLVPWRLYWAYGCEDVVAQSFESARRWVDWVHATNPGLLYEHGKPRLEYGDWLNGDTIDADGWLQAGGEMPKNAFATAWFAHSARVVGRIARVLGDNGLADEYIGLSDRIAGRFQHAFLGTDGRIDGDTQAGYALALHFELVDERAEGDMLGHLVRTIEERDGALSTGIQSTLPLMLELSRRNRHDLAVQIARRRDLPSWGFMLDNGATTIWERWDGYVPGRGFQTAKMNSFSHVAFGAVVQWMFEAVAGIAPEAPGYERVRIEPRVGGGLTWASAQVDTVRGPVRSSWRLEDGSVELEVSLPPNTSGHVRLPTSRPSEATVYPSRRPADLEPNAACFELGSGTYRLAAPR